MQAAGELGLLQVGSNMFVGHLMLPGLDEVVLLSGESDEVPYRESLGQTSSSDQARPCPPPEGPERRCPTAGDPASLSVDVGGVRQPWVSGDVVREAMMAVLLRQNGTIGQEYAGAVDM